MAASDLARKPFDDGGRSAVQAAFATYGLDVQPGRTAELARGFRAEEPTVREALLVALTTGISPLRIAGPDSVRGHVRELAEAADDDPWRKALPCRNRHPGSGRVTGLERRGPHVVPAAVQSGSARARFGVASAADEAWALLRWRVGVTLPILDSVRAGFARCCHGKEKKIGSRGCRRVYRLLPRGGGAAPRSGRCPHQPRSALQAKGQLDEAIAAYREPSVNKDNALGHYNSA